MELLIFLMGRDKIQIVSGQPKSFWTEVTMGQGIYSRLRCKVNQKKNMYSQIIWMKYLQYFKDSLEDQGCFFSEWLGCLDLKV